VASIGPTVADAVDARAADAPAEPPVSVVRPPRGIELNLRELWSYRDLLYFLVWRDFKVRYKQTVIGAAWAVLQPVLTMILFVVFFGRLAGLPVNGVSYPLFFYSGILAWMYFAQAVSGAAQSMVEHQQIVTKVYFPRLLLPVAAVVVPLLDLGIASFVLFGLMAFYRHVPGITLLAAPFIVLLIVLMALGAGFWLTALNVRYRDFRYALPFFIQVLMFASPVAYSTAIVPPAWRAWYGLNPVVGAIEAFRWATLGLPTPPTALLASSTVGALLLLVSGLIYFQKTEHRLADLV
jgi:lipopolysaccharide transport system permease protein